MLYKLNITSYFVIRYLLVMYIYIKKLLHCAFGLDKNFFRGSPPTGFFRRDKQRRRRDFFPVGVDAADIISVPCRRPLAFPTITVAYHLLRSVV